MCRSREGKNRTSPWLTALAVLIAAAFLSSAPAYGQAGVGGSATPTFTSPIAVGSSGAAATLAIQNASADTTAATFANIQMNICNNAGSSFDGVSTFSCASAANNLPGVLTFSTTGTGTSNLGANPTCNGTWTLSTSGNHVTFTGPSGVLTLSTSPEEKCTISFTMGATWFPP